MPQLYDNGIFSVNDTDGSVGVGWKLWFYQVGTSTPKDTYPTEADAVAGTNANQNPVVADAGGRFPPIWFATSAGDYKAVLTNASDVVKGTKNPAGQGIDASIITYGSSTVEGVLEQEVHLLAYGLNKAGLLAALAVQQSSGGTLVLPPGTTTIASWDAPFSATAPLYISGQNRDASVLEFTNPTASFIHLLDPVLEWSDFTISGLTTTTSSNGGSAVYSLAADSIGADVAPVFRRIRFDGCKAPINIEVPFDGAQIRDCEYLNGTGHGFRFGHTTGVGSWGTWQNLSVIGWKVRDLETIGPGNNVYAGLAYGQGHYFDGFDIDGVVGTTDRNGAGYAMEAGGLHIQGRNILIGENNKSKNISGAEVVRHLMMKGETNATNCRVMFWDADCGGATYSEGLAWYAKSGYANVRVYDPGQIGVTVGTSCQNDYSHLNVELVGTNRAAVSGVSGAWDDGTLKFTGSSRSFVKDVTIASSAGTATPKFLLIDMDTADGNGTGIEVYLGVSVNEVVINGSTAIANNSNCRWVRGLSSSVTVNKLTMRGALTNVAGYGTVLDTITINSIDLDQHVSGTTTPGRELSGTAVIKSGIARTNIYGATTNGTAQNSVSLPVADGSSVTMEIRANGKDGTDDYQITREHGFGASGGAATLRGSFPRLVQRSGGATGWDAAAVASGANAVVQFTGAVGKTVTHKGTVSVTWAA